MTSRAFYEIHRKDPIEKKLELLIEAAYWRERRAVSREESFWHRSKENEDYYRSEYRYMDERMRYLYWAIREDLKEMKGDTYGSNQETDI